MHFPRSFPELSFKRPDRFASRHQAWRPLMGRAPSAEALGWVVLVLLTFAPAIGWWLAGGLRRLFT
jgi:hypothetical protein